MGVDSGGRAPRQVDLRGGWDGRRSLSSGHGCRARPNGKGRGKRAHAIESEHGERQERRPPVGRERNMNRRKGGEKMVLGGPDGPFRRVGAVLVGGNVFIGDILRDEISRE